MYNLQAVTDFISRGAELYRHVVPSEWNPYPNAAALTAALVGFILAFWGARLLRTIYVIAYMAGGAFLGFEVGKHLQIDPLIGLTFGGGIAGFIGYFFYRWWVGMTTGLLAVFIVLIVAWPRLQDVGQEYMDHRSGVGSSDYRTGPTPETPLAVHAQDFSMFLLKERRDFGVRLLFACCMAMLLGIVTGMLLPRFTTVMGTSLLGVLLLGIGIGVMLWRYQPNLWSQLSSRPDWYLIASAVLLIVAAWKQLRPGKLKLAAPPPAAAPPAAAAK